MKNLFYVLALFAIFSITSCSSDDDGVVVTEELVAGDWDLQSLDYTGTTTTSSLGVSSTTDFVGEAVDIDFMVSFNENPQTASSSGVYDIELTTTTDGVTTMSTEPAAEDFVFNGTWSLNGNLLTVGDATSSAEYEVIELTPNRMVLDLDTEVSEDFFGISVVATIDGVVVLTK